MKILQGQVNTTPANLDYIQKDCPTGNEGDKPSCAQIGYSGHACISRRLFNALIYVDSD